MESLVTKLENEVGLSHEQALKTIGCVRSYMIENDLELDWEEFIESKAKKMSESAKQAWYELSGKSQTWADKAQDTIEEWSDKAKQTIKDARNKAADFIADKD